jgi:hypothetical protein
MYHLKEKKKINKEGKRRKKGKKEIKKKKKEKKMLARKQQTRLSSMVSSNRWGYSLYACILTLMSIWLMTITIIYFLLWSTDRSNIKEIKVLEKNITEEVETVIIPCCTDIPDNCTCNVTQFETLCWNADDNEPTLISGTGPNGVQYITCVDGNTILDGNTNWEYGDYARFVEDDEDSWFKNDAKSEEIVFDNEVYNFTIIRQGAGETDIDVNITVNLIMLEDNWVEFQLPEFFMEGTPDQPDICDPGPNVCPYIEMFLISFTALPSNRWPVSDIYSNLFYRWSNCLSNETFVCGCDVDDVITTGTADDGSDYARFFLSSTTGFFSFALFGDGVTGISGDPFFACVDIYQLSFLYQIDS